MCVSFYVICILLCTWYRTYCCQNSRYSAIPTFLTAKAKCSMVITPLSIFLLAILTILHLFNQCYTNYSASTGNMPHIVTLSLLYLMHLALLVFCTILLEVVHSNQWSYPYEQCCTRNSSSTDFMFYIVSLPSLHCFTS
jgi:hypothetical protein